MNDQNADEESLLRQLSILTEMNEVSREWRQKLAGFINGLITNDFEQLLRILYRMDIDELKLRTALHQNPDRDAGDLIAELMIERQLQKIQSKKQQQKPPDESEELW